MHGPRTLYYAVAVVRKGSGFQLNELQGRKSCHTGLGRSAGWNVPINLLLSALPEPRVPIESAVSRFFSGSCVPCADSKSFPRLCQLCAGTTTDKCACNPREPFFGDSGAFKVPMSYYNLWMQRCLKDGVGDVCFVGHMTVFENLPDKADRDQYELLCPDNTRKPVDSYKECHLAQVPSHAIVARNVDGKENLIWELLNKAQESFGKDKSAGFQLFGSPYGKDLLFTDAARGFLKVPPKMDAWLYLGYKQAAHIQDLRGGEGGSRTVVRWCAVGPHERAKCDNWHGVSGGAIDCTTEDSPEDCIAAIVKRTADATSLDGGHVYTAGKCGLVPVVAENYTAASWSHILFPQGGEPVQLIPQPGLPLPSPGHDCLLLHCCPRPGHDEFFSRSCAPGSDRSSSLCSLCSSSLPSPARPCVPNSQETYYGSAGAFRCLVEKGDVAFVKHSAVLQNTDGKNPSPWAKHLKQEDFELLCLDGTRKPVTEARNCHLAAVPSNAVVSRKEKAEFVRRILFNQQELFGRNGFEYAMFQLFASSGQDLLFSDDTECLASLRNKTTYEQFLGPENLMAVKNLRPYLTSGLGDTKSCKRMHAVEEVTQ
ncbi:inhibitor of carbonic anhydrase-like [Tenrec ecaudatus]|uniref:inhibitor of carbonic anhydrase-like n=1 Tax=Tenrec ecaudatus TaxID=94439 RepID=UPI003F5A1510